MRKVIISGTPPADWVADAEAVTSRLRVATPEQRSQIIDDESKLWRDDRIRNWLLAQFANKCWYTEAKESVSPYHVDHYRPKGRVKDLDGNESEGYWWLAFQWTNYRICGHLINTKKHDFFPIVEGHRADPVVIGSLELEAPLLIDPLSDKTRLISYELDADGCIAEPAAGIDDVDERMARETIGIFGLNRINRLNLKRREFWDKCMDAIADYQSATGGPYPLKLAQQTLATKKLRRMIEYEEEFSSVVEACVRKNAPPPLIASVFEHYHAERPDNRKIVRKTTA